MELTEVGELEFSPESRLEKVYLSRETVRKKKTANLGQTRK